MRVLDKKGRLYEAFQWDGGSPIGWPEWLRASPWHRHEDGRLRIDANPENLAFEGWWILRRDGDGVMTALKPDDFERLMKPKEPPPIPVTPVKGYQQQTQAALDLVNANKELEERCLRVLDLLATLPDVDKRWLAIARTSIEQGWMAANRAIFKPGRVDLD